METYITDINIIHIRYYEERISYWRFSPLFLNDIEYCSLLKFFYKHDKYYETI